MAKIYYFPFWKPVEMSREPSEEEKKIIMELVTKITTNEVVDKIFSWIQTFSDEIQIILMESIDVMIKNLDSISKHPNKDRIVSELLKQKEMNDA